MLVLANFPPPIGTNGLQVTSALYFQDHCSSYKTVPWARTAWLLWVAVTFLSKFLVLPSWLCHCCCRGWVQPPCSCMSESFPTVQELMLGGEHSWHSKGGVVVCAWNSSLQILVRRHLLQWEHIKMSGDAHLATWCHVTKNFAGKLQKNNWRKLFMILFSLQNIDFAICSLRWFAL